MKEIELDKLRLKTFTEQNASDYCLLNNINPDNIEELWLSNNELTDISGIRLFKNVKELYLYNNKLTNISVIKNLNNLKILNLSSSNNSKIKNISVIQYLNNLETLNIGYLELKSDQIQYINKCKNLKILYCRPKGFKDMSVVKHIREVFK